MFLTVSNWKNAVWFVRKHLLRDVMRGEFNIYCIAATVPITEKTLSGLARGLIDFAFLNYINSNS